MKLLYTDGSIPPSILLICNLILYFKNDTNSVMDTVRPYITTYLEYIDDPDIIY